MGLFDTQLEEINAFIHKHRSEGRVQEFSDDTPVDWPSSLNKNLVLGTDTAVELGDPRQASVSFLVWNDQENPDAKSKVTLIGPDLAQMKEQKAPFGKVVIINGNGFDEDNSFDRYLKLDQARYDIRLDGYMMRSTSQYQREWSRISKTALKEGFSLGILGRALIQEWLKNDFVSSAQVIFVTSGTADVLELQQISEAAAQKVGAMNKMADAMHVEDCGECEYNDVCSDVAELRAMRKKNKNEGTNA